MSTYTVENFENDLQQLGGMIEGFYQNGGKKKKATTAAKAKAVTKKVAKKKMVKRHQDGGEAKRRFKIVEVNGHPYPYPRPYRGAEPLDAAKKAFKFACKKLSMSKDACKLTFTLKETTRGSKKREYGPYQGKWMKLPRAKVYTTPKGERVSISHKHHVELLGKSK
jgi:hypothetical protein